MKILVTGSTGFLGSRVVPLLSKHHQVTSFKGDLLTVRTLPKYDCIVHLAALVPKTKSEDTKLLYEKNIRMTKNLLAASRTKHLIFASTVEVFSPRTWYGKSKLVSEKLCTDATILRFSVMYGAGDRINRAIPNFINAAILGTDITIAGANNQRDYLHVDDAAYAIVCAVNHPTSGIFFIGTGHATTIRQAARAIAPDAKIIEKPAPKHDLLFDTRPAFRALQFKPRYIFPDRVDELMPKPIVFDLDGTMLDVTKKYAAIPKDRFDTLIETPKYLALDSLYPKMKEVLSDVYGKIPLYLVTMRKNRKNLLWQLKKLGLSNFFPDKRVINPKDKIQAVKKIKPALVIGDTQLDMQAAKGASARSFLVTRRNRSKLRAIMTRLYEAEPHYRHPRVQRRRLD